MHNSGLLDVEEIEEADKVNVYTELCYITFKGREVDQWNYQSQLSVHVLFFVCHFFLLFFV